MKLFANILLAALVGLASSASLAADEHAATPSAAPAKPAKPDPAKGDTLFNATPANSQSCASCHNADGNSAIAANPKLAQQHPEYILKQLQDFKSGKRKNAIMSPMASRRSASKTCATSPGSWARRRSSPASRRTRTPSRWARRSTAAASASASPGLRRLPQPQRRRHPAQYPRLGGQNADYTVAQLTAFRDNVRLNSVPMTGVAAKLNDREIRAVADYIAGLR
jgi:cytochrome c553